MGYPHNKEHAMIIYNNLHHYNVTKCESYDSICIATVSPDLISNSPQFHFLIHKFQAQIKFREHKTAFSRRLTTHFGIESKHLQFDSGMTLTLR